MSELRAAAGVLSKKRLCIQQEAGNEHLGLYSLAFDASYLRPAYCNGMGGEKSKPMQKPIAAAIGFLRIRCVSSALRAVPNSNFNPDDANANVNHNEPENSNDNLGARRSAKDYRPPKDFSHPPSIRPISAMIA